MILFRGHVVLVIWRTMSYIHARVLFCIQETRRQRLALVFPPASDFPIAEEKPSPPPPFYFVCHSSTAGVFRFLWLPMLYIIRPYNLPSSSFSFGHQLHHHHHHHREHKLWLPLPS